jgi:hypothetical protein
VLNELAPSHHVLEQRIMGPLGRMNDGAYDEGLHARDLCL